MSLIPFGFDIQSPDWIPSHYDNHIQRKLSSMQGQYLNLSIYSQMLEEEDSLLYEVYEVKRPELQGELLHGISIVHPGKVGEEFFMTKGHYHTILESAEIYYTLKGRGFMVMENPEGEWSVEELYPGRVLYVPPRWAHRSVNASGEGDLVTFFVYPGNAGHNYGTIEQQGFRKLVVEREGKPLIIDNPRWKPAETR
jgi:glucose-6-phosphate isomerase, archaeal